jgi:hypothetical protein
MRLGTTEAKWQLIVTCWQEVGIKPRPLKSPESLLCDPLRSLHDRICLLPSEPMSLSLVAIWGPSTMVTWRPHSGAVVFSGLSCCGLITYDGYATCWQNTVYLSWVLFLRVAWEHLLRACLDPGYSPHLGWEYDLCAWEAQGTWALITGVDWEGEEGAKDEDEVLLSCRTSEALVRALDLFSVWWKDSAWLWVN